MLGHNITTARGKVQLAQTKLQYETKGGHPIYVGVVVKNDFEKWGTKLQKFHDNRVMSYEYSGKKALEFFHGKGEKGRRGGVMHLSGGPSTEGGKSVLLVGDIRGGKKGRNMLHHQRESRKKNGGR